MITWPARASRPARPATCVMVCARRSVALANGQQRLRATRTYRRYVSLRTAVMTAQLERAAVQRHACVAMRAGGDPTAGIAEQSRRVAAPIQEYDDLTAGVEALLDRLDGRRSQPLLR